MRSSTPPDLAGRCNRCFLVKSSCLCAEMPRIETRTAVLVVRHMLESTKTTNTARLAQLAMPHAKVLEYGSVRPMDPEPIRAPGTWLVFPGNEVEQPPDPPPQQLLVIDGTWSQARHMLKRYPAFRGLPRLALGRSAKPWRNLRTAPFDGAMSTLEAIGEALRIVEGDEVADQLRALNDRFVDRILSIRGRRRGPDAPAFTAP